MKKDKQLSNIRFAALAVDIVCFRIFEGEIQVLVGKVTAKDNPFKGKWALIGGLVRVEETAEQSASRLLMDKTGIQNIYKEQLYTFSEVSRDPRGRVVSVAYIALTSDLYVQGISKARMETMWVDVINVPSLAYDHNKVLSIAVDRLKTKITYSDIVRHLINKEFTLSELQLVYEIVLSDNLDKRNFRKRILSLGILKELNKKSKKGVMRPASVYSFNKKIKGV